MAKKPINQNKPWVTESENQLKKLIKQNTPTDVLAFKLGRTEAAIRAKAQELGLSLKPTNKHPDKGHKKK